MRYIKITIENAESLLVDGVILAHCEAILPENDLDEITEDRLVDIVERIDSKGVTIIMPDATTITRYELNYFTNGHWWLKDFSKERREKNDGSKYLILIVSIILLSLSVYMFECNLSFSGFYGPGRSGGSLMKGTFSAPFVLLLGLGSLAMFIVSPRDKRKKK